MPSNGRPRQRRRGLGPRRDTRSCGRSAGPGRCSRRARAARPVRAPLLRGPSPPPVVGPDRGQTLLLSQLTPERQSHAVPRRGFPAARRRGETAESRLPRHPTGTPSLCPPGRLHRERERVLRTGQPGSPPRCGRIGHTVFNGIGSIGRLSGRRLGRFDDYVQPRNNEFAPPFSASVTSISQSCV